MDVVSVSALRTASLVWQPRPSTWVLTVVAKATYALRPGEAALAPEQDDPTEDDDHWDDDPARSVRAPSDLAPAKPHAEVVLVGHAFAPGRALVRSLVARLVIGEIDKAIQVVGDRSLGADGSLHEGAPFTRMPLRYERAAGGPGTWNPIGVRADARDASGRRVLPNLQRVDTHAAGLDAPIEPVGFGPIAPAWPTRVEHLGPQATRAANASAFTSGKWRDRPLPEGADLGYFDVAPPDQQLTALRGNERITLENLHPEYPHLVTTLPGVRPAAFIDRDQGTAQRLALRADLLLIDTDRSIATLTWRGQLPLEHPDETGHVVIGLELPGQELTWADLERTLHRRRNVVSAAAPADAPRPAPRRRIFDEHEEAAASVPVSGARATLPITASPEHAGLVSGLPFHHAAPPVAEPRAPSPGIGLPFQPTPAPASPWAAPPPLVPPPPLGISAAAFSVPQPDLRPARPEGEPLPSPEVSATTRELLQLLWFDPEAAPRIRRVDRWKSVLDQLEQRPPDRALDVGAAAKDPFEAEDLREVFEIIARGSRTDARGVDEALEGAVQEDGKFVPPLVLITGDLETPFDEIEALKAAVAVASPVTAPTDEALRAALAVARDLLHADPPTPPSVAEAATARVREAFTREKKALTPEHLDAQMERLLLSGRHYQKRDVLGDSFLRALFWMPGEPSPRLAYLPAGLAKKLPMYRRTRARLLAEVHPAQDQFEAQPYALRALAVARLGMGAARS